MAGNTIEDLMFLFGHKKKPGKMANKWDKIKIQAENAWYDGKNADANPYNPLSHRLEYSEWDSQWKRCNTTLA